MTAGVLSLIMGMLFGFLIRGRPKKRFSTAIPGRLAWSVGAGAAALTIGYSLTVQISSVVAVSAFSAAVGTFAVLMMADAVYRKWTDRRMPIWLGTAAVVMVSAQIVFIGDAERSESTPTKNSDERRPAPQDGVSLMTPREYLGVPIGASEREARYILGPPIDDEKRIDGRVLRFTDASKLSEYEIFLNSGSIVSKIKCVKNCPELLSIRIGDKEEKILSLFPSGLKQSFIIETDGSAYKTMMVTDMRTIEFRLERGRVTAMSLSLNHDASP